MPWYNANFVNWCNHSVAAPENECKNDSNLGNNDQMPWYNANFVNWCNHSVAVPENECKND